MKKKLILFILLPAIALAANTSSFYERAYALQKHSVRTIETHAPKEAYRQTSRNMTPSSFNRASSAKVTALDSKKFFYANKAANKGNVKAQFDLAMMYASGRGVQKNEKIAFNWFHKSARNNYAPAKHYMGLNFL